jgi:catechol 2,3-dioxygenase-like lactoylglutathione lyase family enzyme
MGTPGIGLEYVVLRCADLERSRAFYEALGLDPVAEQHGGGARHYACAVGRIVLELYPSSGKPTSGLRLGLGVENVGAVVDAMRRAGADLVRADVTGPSPQAVLRDPDGHEVVLVGGRE